MIHDPIFYVWLVVAVALGYSGGWDDGAAHMREQIQKACAGLGDLARGESTAAVQKSGPVAVCSRKERA